MDDLEYIDDYFSAQPVPERTREFEERLAADPQFAGEVVFYLNAREAAKEAGREERKKRFAEIFREMDTGAQVKPRFKLWPYLAAAAVFAGVLFGWYLFIQPPAAQKLSARYISDNFQNLGITMSNEPDSLQAALQLFNEGKLTGALRRFEAIMRLDGSGFTAQKYAGITCLRLGQYDKALTYFKQLERHTELHGNPGKFYQAVTYLRRNQAGDLGPAKELLLQVVNQNLEGKETAQTWLKQL